MLELNVSSKNPSAITAAFKKLREMVKTGSVSSTTPIHVTLEAGIYTEIISYNLSNPLIMESAPGVKAEECLIQAENCEKFHKGFENRAVFVIGSAATNVTLRNFTIINTHEKIIMEGSTENDSAEAFCWNNYNGTLFTEGMRFIGHQNTLALRGTAWLLKSYVSGDVDVIFGEVNTVLFEDCQINLCKDNRGDFDAYAVKSLALAKKPGFVFLNCNFTCDTDAKGQLYVMRTAGKGKSFSNNNWDSIALIKCKVDEKYNEEFAWDDDHELEVYPRGNEANGWREYNTKIVKADGTIEDADTSRRNVRSHLLNDAEYFNSFASRYLILHDTKFAEYNGRV